MLLSLRWKAFALLIFIVIGLRFYYVINHELATNAPTTALNLDSSGQLFNDLYQQGQINISSDGIISLPESDKALNIQQSKGEVPSYAKLIEDLYTKTKVQGERVRKQVDLWNLGHQLAAIRDDRVQTNAQNAWKVSDVTSKRALASVALVPAEFIYVGGENLRPGFHDWRAARAPHKHMLLFQTEIPLDTHASTVHIQIIGHLEPETLKNSLKAYQPKLEARMPNTCQPTNPQAWELTLSLPAGNTPLSLSIPVQMAQTEARRLEGVAICAIPKDALIKSTQDECLAQAPNTPLSDQASLENSADAEVEELEDKPQAANPPPTLKSTTAPPETCQPMAFDQYRIHWASKRLYTPSTARWNNQRKASYTLYTLDQVQNGKPQGQALTLAAPSKAAKSDEFTGEASTLTEQLGLLPLIGQNKDDRYALSGLLNQSNLPANSHTDIYLTLNTAMQQAAQTILSKHVKQQQHANAAGALVVINPQTGAILAAANAAPHPLTRGVHDWDRNAYAQIYPQKDPSQFRPWQGETGFNAPGSSFKLVTTLASLQAIKNGTPNRQQLETMLQGVKRAQFKAVTGLSPELTSFTHAKITKPIANYHNIPLSQSFKPQDQVGLTEALRDSVNNWFIQLSFLADYATLPNGEKTQLSTMAEQLGFSHYFSLVPNTAQLQRIPAANGGRGDVLNAFAGQLSVQNPQAQAGQLAFNSIGQDMTVSPLQMAKVAATIATGQIKQPYLFAWWNDEDWGDQYAASQALDVPHLDWLHKAMKAVVDSGTARGHFGNLTPYVYGKTGTAQAQPKGEALQDTAWFIGFYTKTKPSEASLAFACQITRADGGGGKICAPTVAEFLQTLDKAKLLEVKHAQP
jgi:hypothetical protein